MVWSLPEAHTGYTGSWLFRTMSNTYVVRSSTRRQVVLQRRCQPTNAGYGIGGGGEGFTRCRALAPLHFSGICTTRFRRMHGHLRRSTQRGRGTHPCTPEHHRALKMAVIAESTSPPLGAPSIAISSSLRQQAGGSLDPSPPGDVISSSPWWRSTASSEGISLSLTVAVSGSPEVSGGRCSFCCCCRLSLHSREVMSRRWLSLHPAVKPRGNIAPTVLGTLECFSAWLWLASRLNKGSQPSRRDEWQTGFAVSC